MGSVADVARHASAYPNASGLLLDSHARGARGGLGSSSFKVRSAVGSASRSTPVKPSSCMP